MNDQISDEINDQISDEIKEFLLDLISKANVTYEKTEGHANMWFIIDDLYCPLRVDDKQLFYLGSTLLPNIVNYLFNILPQFLYPYIVAYCQDLSKLREDPFTINELFNVVKDLKENGNFFKCPETES